MIVEMNNIYMDGKYWETRIEGGDLLLAKDGYIYVVTENGNLVDLIYGIVLEPERYKEEKFIKVTSQYKLVYVKEEVPDLD